MRKRFSNRQETEENSEKKRVISENLKWLRVREGEKTLAGRGKNCPQKQFKKIEVVMKRSRLKEDSRVSEKG